MARHHPGAVLLPYGGARDRVYGGNIAAVTRRVRVAGFGLFAALGLACAVGDDPDIPTTFGPSPASGTPPATSGGSTTQEGTRTTEAPSDGGDAPSSGGDTTGMMEETSTTSGDSSSGGEVDPCTNLETCPTSPVIGGVSGDESSRDIEFSGAAPIWVRFQVSENDNSLVGSGLSFTVTLTSPVGADFDLYVYRGPAGGSRSCGGVSQNSTNDGAVDSVSMSWGEGGIPNGADDGAWVAVEVRAKDNMCAPPEQWMLLIEGNTQ